MQRLSYLPEFWNSDRGFAWIHHNSLCLIPEKAREGKIGGGVDENGGGVDENGGVAEAEGVPLWVTS